jgi:branched-chain amino acid transport system permease protein
MAGDTSTRPSRAAGVRRKLPKLYDEHLYAQIAVFAVGLALVVGLTGFSDYTLGLINQWLLYSIMTLGFFLVFGLSGQFAFSQAAFVGLGAYASVWASRSVSIWLALLFAIVITAAVALVFSVLMGRASHFYFAISSLAVAQIMQLVFLNWKAFAGTSGQILNTRPLSLWGYRLTTQYKSFWLLAGTVLVLLVLVALIIRSPLRRQAFATRDAEMVSHTFGIPVRAVKIILFVVGSAVAGAGGAFFAHWQRSFGPESFDVNLALAIYLMLILGGIKSIWGAVIGAAFYVWLPARLISIQKYESLMFGGLLVILMIFIPDGLIGVWAFGKRWALIALGREAKDSEPPGQGKGAWRQGPLARLLSGTVVGQTLTPAADEEAVGPP